MQRTRTRNGWFAFTLMREKIFNEKNGLSSGRGRRRNACFSLSLLPKNLSKVGSGGGALRHIHFRYASCRGEHLRVFYLWGGVELAIPPKIRA